MRLHREGHVFLIISFLILIFFVTILVYFLKNYPFILYAFIGFGIAFYLLIVQFFRNPKRSISINDRYVLSPADGKIVVIEETYEAEYFHDKCVQISIFMSPFNVHVNRNPINGVVKYVKYHKGKYLVAWHPKSSTENERTSIVFQHTSGYEILVRQIAGALAKRIKWYVKENEKVAQGEEFGFIKFGSRVDVFIPLHFKVNVEIGEVVKGGISVLALTE